MNGENEQQTEGNIQHTPAEADLVVTESSKSSSAGTDNASKATLKSPQVKSGSSAPQKSSMLPPAARKAVPRVPDFEKPSATAAVSNGSDKTAEDKRIKAAVLAAASKAGRDVTPAQREKAIAEAAAAAASAYAAHKLDHAGNGKAESLSASQSKALSQESKRPTPGQTNAARQVQEYAEPAWGGVPPSDAFWLEIMKGGQIIEEQKLAGKSHFVVGRSERWDFFLEHPSISRMHAVLQFSGEGGAPTLYDCSSVHGTFLNKKRLKPGVWAPLSVGDMIRFGQSSRLFILGGPVDLMPEEGLSCSQKQQLAALEAKEKRKLREQELAKAQMTAALNAGISWGMGEDAGSDGEEGGAPTVEWRTYAQTHSLTDHQQKLAEKARRLENRIRNLTTEADRIKAKQGSMEDLTAGQAAVLARNEQVIDKASEELEELEDLLNESIATSLKGKRGKLESEAAVTKRRRARESEEDENGSDEDDFYDRTAPGSKKRKTAPAAQDAASLFGRKEALLEEKRKLQLQLQEEMAQGESPTETSGKMQTSEPAADPLDAFMSGVTQQLEQSKMTKLQKAIAEADGEVEKLEQLLKQVDPDGYFREGTHAARIAREKGLRLYNQDKEREAALAKKKRQDAAKKAAEEAAAKQFVPETEAEDPTEGTEHAQLATSPSTFQKPQENIHRLEAPEEQGVAGLAIQNTQGTQHDSAPKSSSALPIEQPTGGSEADERAKLGLFVPQRESEAKKKRDAMIRAALAKEKAAKLQQAPGSEPEKPAQSQDMVMADLALLRKASSTEIEAKDEKEAGWKPPEGQKGDGRTTLNDRLGY